MGEKVSLKDKFKQLYEFGFKVYKRVEQDEIFKEAAALTFMTLLSVIPFLMLIFYLIPDIPGFELKIYISDLLLSVLLPESAEKVGVHVAQLLDQNVPTSILNVLLLTMSSFGLFKFISGSFDRILNVKKSENPNIIVKFIKFILMIFFGFLFTLIVLSSTSVALLSQLLHLPLISSVSFIIIPFMIFFSINAFIYFFASSVRPRFKSLMTGALVASALWSFAKLGFDFYITNLTNINRIYGVLASIPIILFWVYLNWIIIIFGVELIDYFDKLNEQNNGSKSKQKRAKKGEGK